MIEEILKEVRILMKNEMEVIAKKEDPHGQHARLFIELSSLLLKIYEISKSEKYAK